MRPLDPELRWLAIIGVLLVLCLLMILTGGCALAPSDEMVRELMASERTWCFVSTSVFGNVRMAGTGIKNGRVLCSIEGFSVSSPRGD